MPEKPKPTLAVWPIDDLKTHEKNPRKIDRARFEDLKRSIKNDPDFLQVRPIVVNVNPTRRGVVIGGNMRLAACRDLGMTEVPVVEVHATPKQERAWLVKDNVHSGEFNEDMLSAMVLEEPETFEHAMPSDMLDDMLNRPDREGPASEEDQVDEVAKAKDHITQPGDVWELGDHRIICADSTAKETFEKLLAGEKAQMTWTDPPYNTAVGDSTNNAGKKNRSIANDDMDAKSWAIFVRSFLAGIRDNTVGAVYIAMSTKEWPSLHAAFIDCGFHWSTTIMWIKDSFVLGRKDYQSKYEPIMVGKVAKGIKVADAEPILYGWPNGIQRKWNGGRDQGDAWFFTRPRNNPVHPTQKPVELVLKAVTNSSSRGDIVLDCFGGGGVNAYRVRAERTTCAARGARPGLLRRDHRAVRGTHQEREAQAERQAGRMDRTRHHDRGRA